MTDHYELGDHSDCLCKPRLSRRLKADHEPGCPEGIPSEAELAWIRASREGDFELWEFTQPDFGLKKRQYIWEMMRNKARISDQAKAKAKSNFEAAVVRYAEYIKGREGDDDSVHS